MSPWKYLVVAACLFLAARAAQAREADAKERAAKTACLAGDYVKGVGLLSELYVSTTAPVYIYNQGRCFEQNHRYEDAISRFREYLRVGKVSRADKTDAQKHVSDCQEQLAKQGGSSSTHEGAVAGNGDSRTAKERDAKKACLTGDADAGVALLADLYVDTNDENLIFNQGRCLEQVGRCQDAMIRFREYLRKTRDAGLASDGRAERHIADCEDILKKAKGGDAPSSSADTSQPRLGSAASVASATATDAHGSGSAGPSQDRVESRAQAGVQASLPQTMPGRSLRIAGGVTFGVGVVGVAAGLGLALAANHLASELEASPSSYQRSKESTRASYARSAMPLALPASLAGCSSTILAGGRAVNPQPR
jgi:tetratricopeptide (TPR) repeat protein